MTRTYRSMLDAFHATRPAGSQLYFRKFKRKGTRYSWCPIRGYQVIRYDDLLGMLVYPEQKP